MKYLLDTNACIQLINGRSQKLHSRIRREFDEDIYISSITRSELYFGAALSRDPHTTREKQNSVIDRFESVVYGDEAAEYYADLRANLKRAGTLIGPNDMLIAATALAYNLILVTHNTREFSRVAGLRLEDWEL